MREEFKEGETDFKRNRGKERRQKRGTTNISWHQKRKSPSLVCCRASNCLLKTGRRHMMVISR